MFEPLVNARIAREGIVVRDREHYEELYVKFRDDLFLEKYGQTFLERRAALKEQRRKEREERKKKKDDTAS